jgi:hypothetical protein
LARRPTSADECAGRHLPPDERRRQAECAQGTVPQASRSMSEKRRIEHLHGPRPTEYRRTLRQLPSAARSGPIAAP